jgi:hypothetical protein
VRYLLLIYGANEDWSQRPAEEIGQALAEHRALADELRRANAYIADDALQPASSSTTVRPQDEGIVVANGPYSDSSSHIAGFYLIDVESHDQALECARRMVEIDGDPVEVRPVIQV